MSAFIQSGDPQACFETMAIAAPLGELVNVLKIVRYKKLKEMPF